MGEKKSNVGVYLKSAEISRRELQSGMEQLTANPPLSETREIQQTNVLPNTNSPRADNIRKGGECCTRRWEEEREGRKLKRLGRRVQSGETFNPNRVWPYESPSFCSPNFTSIAYITLFRSLKYRRISISTIWSQSSIPELPSGFYPQHYAAVGS